MLWLMDVKVQNYKHFVHEIKNTLQRYVVVCFLRSGTIKFAADGSGNPVAPAEIIGVM